MINRTTYKPLSEIAIINPGKPRLKDDAKVSFLGMAEVNEDGTTARGQDKYWQKVSKGYTAFQNRDILFAKITPCFENGKIAQASIGHPYGAGSTEFHVIRPIENIADHRYLLHYLRIPWIRQLGKMRMTGSAGQRRVPEIFLKALKIPIPPLEEQRRIAEILDLADGLRVKRREALAEVEGLTEAVFLEMFGDPREKRFLPASFKDVFDFRTGKLNSNAANENGRYKFFTCSREDAYIDTYAFDQEALLLSGNNASGDYSVKYFKGKFNAYQRTYVITVADQATYPYARASLERQLLKLKYMSKGSSTKYLTLSMLNKLTIPLPPLPLQQKFAERVEAIEKLKASHQRSLEEMDALFASLQSRAFKGEL